MKYVLAIIFIVFVATGFAAYGLKESPTSAAESNDELAAELDHIADDYEATQNGKQVVLLLRNKANTLRQAQASK